MCSNLFSQEPFIGDTIEIEHYNLYLEVTNLSNGILYGTAETMVVSKLNNLQFAPFFLLKMNIDEVKVNGTSVSNWYYNDTLLRVPLVTHLNVGDDAEISITYHGSPIIESYGWGGFHFSSSAAYNLGVAFEALPHCYGRSWFPCADDFITRSTYDMFVTTDSDKKAICGGLLMDSVINANNTITWHWKLNQTIPSYLVSVAVANYSEIEMHYNGINGDIPMYIHVSASQVNGANQLFDILPDVMQAFEESWGAYPFDRVGFVSTGLGAMEHATNIAFPSNCFSPTVEYERLFAHELSHMWFGDFITCCRAEEMWINEGWATYNEILFMEKIYGAEAAQTYYKTMNQTVLTSAHGQDGGFYPLNNLPQDVTYGTNAYKKGGVIVHTLRNYLGDDVFFPAITAFLQAHAYHHVCSEDLMNFLTDFTGLDMNAWFEGWVFNAGSPGFEIDSVVTYSNENDFVSTVYVEQKRFYGNHITNENRVPCTLFNEDLTQEITVTVPFSGKTGFLSNISTNFEPKFAYIDYYDKMSDGLLAATKTITSTGNNSLVTNLTLVVDEITNAATLRGEYFLFEPDPLKTPVTGLILSNKNYWRLSGIGAENFISKGMFVYARSTMNLDTIFANPTETELSLLYRQNANYDWQIIPSTKYGSNTNGFLLAENIQLGEYCLAVLTNEYNPIEEIETTTQTSLFKVFPVPSQNNFNIQFEKGINGTIYVFDTKGTQVETFPIYTFQTDYQWTSMNLKSGIYFIRVVDEKQNVVGEKKVILSK